MVWTGGTIPTPNTADFVSTYGGASAPGDGFTTAFAPFCAIINATGSPPPPPGEIFVVVKGTHELRVYTDKFFVISSQYEVQWRLSGGPEHLLPLVAKVELVANNAVKILTDRPMHQDTTYTLEFLINLFGESAPPAPVTFNGIRTDVFTAPEKQEEAVLVDYWAPFVQGNDGAQAAFKTGDAGDFIMKGGLESLLGIIWHRVLTRVGELYYAPRAGFDLRHKGLMPADIPREQRRMKLLLREIPYVNDADVTLRKEGHALIVTLRVDSDLGSTTTSRRFEP